MTCKDCIHEDVCKIRHFPSMFGLTGDGCPDFKNKANFVEVETIKSWLYEIAMNNVGIAFDGDFSKACEDIISRLDGLKRYSIEKEGADNGKQ